jgi:ABC-2 type transport system ATP-binding protein
MKKDLILNFEKIKKSFGQIIALDDVSFNVDKNSIHGILGPNGSGKSTLMRILSGLIKSWSGNIFLHDQKIQKNSNEYLKSFGFMIEEPSFYEYLSAEENLKIFCRLLNYNFDVVFESLKRVDLYDWRKTKVKNFSYGMKQRLGIAQAILHDPDILILDEPNNGLDPKGIADMNSLIEGLQEEGKTICISTHILKDVERLCDSVTVLKKGKLILNSSIKDLMIKSKLINISSTKISQLEDYLKNNIKSKIIQSSNKFLILESNISIQEITAKIPNDIPITSITRDSGLTELFL